MNAEHRKRFVHAIRLAIFLSIVLLIRSQQGKLQLSSVTSAEIELGIVSQIFAGVELLRPTQGDRFEVIGRDGDKLGFVQQTSPTSDHIVGFSGATNVLIGFSADEEIVGVRVLGSQDTRDHVRQVVADDSFMNSLNGLSINEAKSAKTDAVSGATLTSLAIREAIAVRLGAGARKSLRFPNPPELEATQRLFKDAAVVEPTEQTSVLQVRDAGSVSLGLVVRTSPTSDSTIGYQGPTDALIGIDPRGKIVGVTVGRSFDNEPYVGYVRDDAYLASLFNSQDLNELANHNVEESEFEGVSGATMTSMAVAQGIVAAAKAHVSELEAAKQSDAENARWFSWMSKHDWGTLLCIGLGCLIGFTRLRANRFVGMLWQVTLVGYLGLTAGSLLSQAQLVGWARHGVPVSNAFGLFCLAVAGLSIPVGTKRNLYCSHLCPHGAAQQLLKRRLPWQVSLSARWRFFLRMIPGLLLAWCVVVGMTSLGFSLVDIEPFDAYVFKIAGWATIVIAVIGLLAAAFIPMAYCRYGCPTGAMLEFLRFNAKADHWNRRDWFAVGALLLAIGLRLFS